MRHASSPLRGSRGRTVAMLPVRLFSFGGREASPRPRRSNITPRLAAWACRRFPGFTEPTLSLRALRQASARFRPRPDRTPQLSDRSTSLPRTAAQTLSFRSVGRKLARPDETGRTPMMAVSKDLAADAARDGERLQRSPHEDPECRPGLRPGRLRCQSGRTSALRASIRTARPSGYRRK